VKEKAIDKNILFWNLRKTVITNDVIEHGDIASKSIHGSVTNTLNHYINQREMAWEMSDDLLGN